MKKLKNVDPQYRLYCLTNMYLSGIQKGIQTAHVVSNMANNFSNDTIFRDWASFDKTIIVLNGGNCKSLHAFEDVISNGGHDFPYDWFNEDEESLNGAVTAVGIILPASVYLGKSKNKVHKKIYSFIKDLPLAV